MIRAERLAGTGAGLLFALAALVSGATIEAYSQWTFPVALLGARGIPHATAFNIAGYILPGALAGWLAWHRRTGLTAVAPWSLRLGLGLALLAALAFALQGLMPLDPVNLQAPASRLHAVAWTLWWVAFVPAGLLLAWAALREAPRSAAAPVMHAGCAAVVLATAALWPDVAGHAVSQRIAYGAWFAWLAWWGWRPRAAGAASRGGS